MQPNTPGKTDLLRLMQQVEALQFGQFTLKSGRVSPYFFNSARFRTGGQLARLGHHYAQAIYAAAPDTDIVFGPAYKGVPLCVATAMALAEISGRDIGYLFNRKEAKTHGDKGMFVGQQPQPGQRVAMVDDVITDGLTKHEAVALLREAFDVDIPALVIAFNRMETDSQGGDALRAFEEKTGIPVIALISVADVEEAIAAGDAGGLEVPPGALEDIRAYRREFGIGAAG